MTTIIDARGARGSNAGDKFHELWVLNCALELIDNKDGKVALTVEGLSFDDEKSAAGGALDAVDCAQFFGGQNCSPSAFMRQNIEFA